MHLNQSKSLAFLEVVMNRTVRSWFRQRYRCFQFSWITIQKFISHEYLCDCIIVYNGRVWIQHEAADHDYYLWWTLRVEKT